MSTSALATALGMHLARLELKVFFAVLPPGLKGAQLTGTPTRTAGSVVGGPRYLPVCCEFMDQPEVQRHG